MSTPQLKFTPEQLEIANKSCDTCYFVRRPHYHQPESWKCQAPQNFTPNSMDIVTGKPTQLRMSVYEARHLNLPGYCGHQATWRKAQFVVLDDGSYKHIDQDWTGKLKETFKPTGSLSSSLARLRGLTAEDF